MRTYDSPVVRELVERLRAGSPLGSGTIYEELKQAQQDPHLSARDRGQLVLGEIVLSQGNISAREGAQRIEEAVALLKENGDDESLSSAIAMSAAMHAMVGDMHVCLERCLDLAGRTQTAHAETTSLRTMANFGVAWLALGAYELASEVFADVIKLAIKDYEFAPLMVSSFNLTLSVSRTLLVKPDATVEGGRRFEWLALVEQALETIEQRDDAGNAAEFVNAMRAHMACLRNDLDAAVVAWGDLDALNTTSGESFTRYFCLIETRIAMHTGDLDRALCVVNGALDNTDTRDFLPLRRVEGLRLRSALHERRGDITRALDDARQATALALQKTSQLPDVLISQINQRARLEHSQQHLMDQASELTEQALLDELSQVGNRRSYERALDALRAGAPQHVGVIVCDIDGFKGINDRYGHAAGDRVIARVGQILSTVTRSQDQAFRYGGDEFVLLVSVDSIAGALGLATRLHAAFAAAGWTDDALDQPVTCSIGVGAGSSTAIASLAAEADAQLYEAKRAGRNCVRPLPA